MRPAPVQAQPTTRRGEPPLRVLHVVESWPPVVSGYCSRGWEIAEAQNARPGLIPHVLVSSRQGVYAQGPPQPPPGMAGRMDAMEPSTRERRARRWRRFDLDPAHLRRRIVEACGRWSIDLIHSHWSSGLGAAAADAAGQLGLPRVAEVRFDLAGAVTTQTLRVELPPVERALRRRFERHLAGADAVVAASGSLAGLIRREFPSLGRPVHIMPNAVDAPAEADIAGGEQVRAAHGLSESVVVGTTSNMLRYEGLDRLVRALAQAKRRAAGIHGLLVGSGPEHATLQRLAQRRGAPITFTGRVPRERVPPHLAAMDVFAVPRRDASITRCAAPIKVVEAMAARRAVIATGVGDIPELLGADRGVCLDPKRPGALVDAIVALAKDPALRRCLGEAAANWIRGQPTWADLAQRYEALYRSCLGSGHPRAGAPDG